MKFLGLLSFISVLAAGPVCAQTANEECNVTSDDGCWTTIKNGEMWKDFSGKDVQAHGAGFLQIGDTWYMIGEDRTKPWNPDVNMYSSKDLVNWKFERKIIENEVTHPELGKTRMIERPKLLYCKKTGKYVVWCHWESSNYGASEAGVFVSDNVNGPYRFHWGGRPLGVKSRDCNVFVDDDGTAYFISTIEENQHLGLFRLSDDYLSAVEYTELFKYKSREAPAIVKVDGMYYMLSSACTGWDPNPCKLSCSKSLTSGWSELKQIGDDVAYDTQAASILKVNGDKQTTYLYVGDRWMDPGLPESKTIIFPISFSNGECKFEYQHGFDINFKTGEWKPKEKETLCVIGDSYVRNHSRPVFEAWHSKAAQRLGLRYVNLGINGNCVAFDKTKEGFGKAMTERVGEIPESSSVVMIMAGHNDAYMIANREECTLEDFSESLDKLLKDIRIRCPKAAIGYVTPWNVNRAQFPEVIGEIRKVCKANGVPVLDNTKCVINVNDPAFRKRYFQGADDTAHLNDAGHDLLLGRGEDFIKQLMKAAL